MQRVAVKPEMLQWARRRAGLSIDDLSAFPKLGEWERGERQPTFRQLENYAKRTYTPFGYMFLPEPPAEKLPIPDFRTVADRPMHGPSPNLLDTVYTMQRRQDWYRDYLIEQGNEPLPFVASATVGDNERNVAAQMRSVLRMGDGWAREHRSWEDALRDLGIRMEEAGITVVWNGIVGYNTHRKLDVEEFRGFVLVDDIAPLIFVNNADAKSAQMFTLAHELAHLWIGQGGVLNLNATRPASNTTERFCNRVAAEFLVPEDELRIIWPGIRYDAHPIGRIARTFRVSRIVAARRLRDLRLIDEAEFLSIYRDELDDASARRSSGGSFNNTAPLRLGRPFAEAVLRAAREGSLLYHEAYQLTGLHGKTFDKLYGLLGEHAL